MAISNYVTLTIKDEKCSSSSGKLFIYQGDVGVDFYFQINSLKVTIVPQSTNREYYNLVDSLVDAWASVRILTPTKQVITRDRLLITEDNLVKLTITKDLTDELSDVGKYKIQIHLYDGEGEDSNRITTPPFDFEVKPLVK